MPPLPSVMIAFPDAGEVQAATAVSLLQSAIRCRQVQAVAHRSSPRVPAARNDLVRELLASELEWLWFVDTDMVFPPDTLERLLEVADPVHRPVVGALCFGLDGREVFPTAMRRNPDGRGYDLAVTWAHGQLLEVDATGAACLLVHRSLLERMREAFPPPHHWFADEVHGGEDVGHDVVFCERVRSLGVPLFLHTGVRVGHLKSRAVDLDSYVRWLTRERYLVTGTGRCGTGYLARLLTLLGLPTGHEQVYNPQSLAAGEVRWGAARGEASWLAAPFLPHFQGEAIHLVRHPLDVAGSFLGIGFFQRRPGDPGWEYTEWACRAGGLEPAADRAGALALAATHWLRWNRAIEPWARLRVRVEDLDVPAVRAISELVGAPRDERRIRQALDQARAEGPYNTRRRDEVSWDEVPPALRPELAEMARRYGY